MCEGPVHVGVFAFKICTCQNVPKACNEVCDERYRNERRKHIDRQHAAVQNTRSHRLHYNRHHNRKRFIY